MVNVDPHANDDQVVSLREKTGSTSHQPNVAAASSEIAALTTFLRLRTADGVTLAPHLCQFHRFHPVTSSPTIEQGVPETRANPLLLRHCKLLFGAT